MSDFDSLNICIPVNELWGFYTQNKKRCAEEMILIAENTDTKYAVYLTDEDGTAMLSVCKGDDEPEYEEYAMDADDMESLAKKLLMRYLVPFTVTSGKLEVADDTADGEEYWASRQDMEDEMYEREDALDLAIKDFLAVVLEEPDGAYVTATLDEDEIQEIMHHILEHLTNNYCLKIRRPMFFEDEESGSEIYSQFPYEEYTFTGDGNGEEGKEKLPD